MQGNGTQENPYIPTAWDEFVYAVGKDKQTYVTMPEGGGVFDMNDIAPTGTSLNVVCKSLEGNDWEMRNAYNVDFNFDGDYNGDCATNLIHKFHFLNMYNDGYTLFHVNISKFSECKFSGVAAGNYALYRGEFERCSMNFKLMDKAELISVNSPYWNQWDFVKAIIDNSDTTTTTGGYQLRANNSLFEYKANSSGSNMSVSGKSNVVHSDAGSLVTIASGSKVDVTEKQLKNAEYLHSIGFPIAGD